MENEDRKDILLRASYDILKRLECIGEYVKNPLGICARWDDGDGDGICLMDNIADLLGLKYNEPPIPLGLEYKDEDEDNTAPTLLRKAAQTIDDRAAERDLPAERSMARAVGAFNTLTGQSLTTTQGWLFVAVLKLARATAGKYNPDDLLDAAAYVALALENELGEQESCEN